MCRLFSILLLCLISVAVVACKMDYYGPVPDDFGPPVVRLSVTPRIADSTTFFRFSGRGSHDSDGMWGIVEYRWDLDGDGSWDTPFTQKTDWVHVFPEPGGP